MPTRKSGPKPRKTTTKPTAAPHGPSEGQDKPARRKAAAKPKPKAPAKKPAAPRKPGGAAASAKPRKPPASAGETVRKLLRTAPADPASPMTPDVEAFISEYLRNGLNGTAAWLTLHPKCTPAAASTAAWRWLRKREIAARIDAVRAGLARKAEMTREQAIRHLMDIIEADASQLTQLRRVRCELCWPGQQVGPYTEPNPECPACDGEGTEVPWFADTRKLPPEMRSLFAGVKVSRDGMQVLMESKDAARDKLFKILGHYKADNEQKGAGTADALRDLFTALHGGAARLPVRGNPLVKP